LSWRKPRMVMSAVSRNSVRMSEPRLTEAAAEAVRQPSAKRCSRSGAVRPCGAAGSAARRPI
jgi:hypothetical protein